MRISERRLELSALLGILAAFGFVSVGFFLRSESRLRYISPIQMSRFSEATMLEKNKGENIDVLLLGASDLCRGLDKTILEDRLDEELKRESNVHLVCFGYSGSLRRYLFLKNYLNHHNVKHVIQAISTAVSSRKKEVEAVSAHFFSPTEDVELFSIHELRFIDKVRLFVDSSIYSIRSFVFQAFNKKQNSHAKKLVESKKYFFKDKSDKKIFDQFVRDFLNEKEEFDGSRTPAEKYEIVNSYFKMTEIDPSGGYFWHGDQKHIDSDNSQLVFRKKVANKYAASFKIQKQIDELLEKHNVKSSFLFFPFSDKKSKKNNKLVKIVFVKKFFKSKNIIGMSLGDVTKYNIFGEEGSLFSDKVHLNVFGRVIYSYVIAKPIADLIGKN